MKKLLFISLLLFTLSTYTANANSEMYNDRGLELIREANFNQILEVSKESGSLQTFETYFEKNKKLRSKGILLGTVSNFVNAPNIHAGLTVAYQKYKFKESDTKDREYALNTYLSYKKNNYLFIGGLSYSQAKNVEKRGYSGNFEIGKFTENQILNFFDKGRFYYYTGIETNKWNYKHSKDINFVNYRLGFSSYHFINNFRLVGNIEVNADSKKYDTSRDKYNLAFSYAVGYQIYDDLLIELKYKGTKNKKFYNNLFVLGFTHTF